MLTWLSLALIVAIIAAVFGALFLVSLVIERPLFEERFAFELARARARGLRETSGDEARGRASLRREL